MPGGDLNKDAVVPKSLRLQKIGHTAAEKGAGRYEVSKVIQPDSRYLCRQK